MKIMYLLLISSLMLFLSCEDNDNSNANKELLEGTWKLNSITDKQSNENIQYPDTLNNNITIEFKSTEKTVHLNGFCNNGAANYIIEDSVITFNNVSMTELICF